MSWRPPHLATDEADPVPVLQPVLEISADVVVVLQATSPIRSSGLINACISRFLTDDLDSLRTVHKDHSYEYGEIMPRR